MREEFLHRKVLILGYGISGKGAEHALLACGATSRVVDESIEKIIFDKAFVSGFDLIVTSPSVPHTHPIYRMAAALDIEIYSEVELGARLFSGKLIGITGTNGKTTTAALIGKIFKYAKIRTSVCGNIGISFASAAVFDNFDVAVVELSSFQLETVSSLKPDIAIITNITPDHLDRHVTFEAYASAKRNIAKNQTQEDTLILSQDDIPLSALTGFRPNANVLYVSTRGKVQGAYLLNGTVYYFDEPIIKRSAIRLSGAHNVANCLFAVCAAKLCGIPNQVITAVLSEFRPEDHRIQLVDRIKGKNFYNDSKGTNIGATLAAVRAMEGSVALILGGKDKGYEFDALIEQLPKSVKHIFAIGETAEKICSAAYRNNFHEIETKADLRGAVLAAFMSEADNVLLSPACSSFDMFNDYADRGRNFEKIVQEISENDKCNP